MGVFMFIFFHSNCKVAPWRKEVYSIDCVMVSALCLWQAVAAVRVNKLLDNICGTMLCFLKAIFICISFCSFVHVDILHATMLFCLLVWKA